jgi:enoyl-CoA hydratase/carnithine racemase
MSEQLIHEWPSERICVLRMNRPDVFNALSRSLLTEMIEAIRALPQTKAAVLILAANGKGFCSGADLKERRSLDDDEKYAHNRLINAMANELAEAKICTIAAINGLAMGGGLEIALGCDLRFAATDAVIGLTEARVGAIPGAGGTQRLPRLIGISRALEMMYSGEPLSAAKAAEWGVVNAAVDPADLMDHVLAYARVVASRSRRTGAILKDVVHRGGELSLAEGLEIERQAIFHILKSDDYREGLAAFAEKRPPVFE